VTKEQKNLSPSNLNFLVTDDEEYKNDTYGVVAIVQLERKERPPAYRIKIFNGEQAFQEYKKAEEYEEILIVFRGEFIVEGDMYDREIGEYMPTRIKATSVKGSDGKVQNVITINNCIDFEDGVLTIFCTDTYGDFGPIHVHFDGSLYTTGSRTSIWKGEAAFTKIEQGKEYGLIQYDENGEREEDKSIGEPISASLAMPFKLSFSDPRIMPANAVPCPKRSFVDLSGNT
jgi:hypothetical protein